MAIKTVNFRQDLPAIRQYIATQTAKQSKIKKPVSAIEVGFQLCQAGLIALHFDVRPIHNRDGEWTRALAGPTLRVPDWRRVFESAEEIGASFVLLTGEAEVMAPGVSERKVAAVFGKALLAIARDAIATGAFDALPLQSNCQLEVEEFDGAWAWPAKYEDVGRTNVIAKMRAARLPR